MDIGVILAMPGVVKTLVDLVDRFFPQLNKQEQDRLMETREKLAKAMLALGSLPELLHQKHQLETLCRSCLREQGEIVQKLRTEIHSSNFGKARDVWNDFSSRADSPLLRLLTFYSGAHLLEDVDILRAHFDQIGQAKERIEAGLSGRSRIGDDLLRDVDNLYAHVNSLTAVVSNSNQAIVDDMRKVSWSIYSS